MRRFVVPLALAAALALVLGLVSPAAASHRRNTYLINPAGPAADDVFPEGVATAGRYFYVGSTADGTIYRGRLSGRSARPFLLGNDDRSMAVGLKVDGRRLFVAGGMTGKVFIYNIRTKRLIGSHVVPDLTPGSTFVNDLTVAKDGSVYVTDSFRPTLYRIAPGDYRNSSPKTLKVFRDFTGTVLPQLGGFNLNGIVATPDGKFVLLANSAAKKLYRLRLADKQVRELRLPHTPVAGDGLVLLGRRLYVVERQGELGFLVKIRLDRRYRSGHVLSRTTYPSFEDPTTAAFARGRLLVVNSQFSAQAPGATPGPFTVSRVPVP